MQLTLPTAPKCYGMRPYIFRLALQRACQFCSIKTKPLLVCYAFANGATLLVRGIAAMAELVDAQR
jgi:hypothetical protein